jgi:GDP-L-fucose synthase
VSRIFVSGHRGLLGSAIVNVGWGKDIRIAELAALIKDIVEYPGSIEFDASKADGTPRKLLDTARRTSLGWQPSTQLADGIASTYRWFKKGGLT